jgi:hypothetical protein
VRCDADAMGEERRSEEKEGREKIGRGVSEEKEVR